MYKVFLDTNILIQYALGNEPDCTCYKKLIKYSMDGKVVLYTSSHSLKDAYYNLHLGLKRQERAETGALTESAANAAKEIAWATVKLLGKQLHIVSMGKNEHEHAFVFRPIHNDYEDDLQLAAAYAAKVNLFVTDDASLKGHSPVAVLNSKETIALLSAEFE